MARAATRLVARCKHVLGLDHSTTELPKSHKTIPVTILTVSFWSDVRGSCGCVDCFLAKLPKILRHPPRHRSRVSFDENSSKKNHRCPQIQQLSPTTTNEQDLEEWTTLVAHCEASSKVRRRTRHCNEIRTRRRLVLLRVRQSWQMQIFCIYHHGQDCSKFHSPHPPPWFGVVEAVLHVLEFCRPNEIVSELDASVRETQLNQFVNIRLQGHQQTRQNVHDDHEDRFDQRTTLVEQVLLQMIQCVDGPSFEEKCMTDSRDKIHSLLDRHGRCPH